MMPVIVTHSNASLNAEKRVPIDVSVARLKEILHWVVGTQPHNMTLQLCKPNAPPLALHPDTATLPDFNVQPFDIIHVVDTAPSLNVSLLQDDSSIPKVSISEDDYDKRPGRWCTSP